MSAVPMMNSDRRQRVRYQVSFSVSLATIDSTLDGQAINASREGVLLEAEGRLGLRVTIKGRDYRGWLVRAQQNDGGKVAYAIELDDDLDLSDE